jgi:hypothetical protein
MGSRVWSKEVEIFRRGDEIILREKDGTMVRAFDLLASLPRMISTLGARRISRTRGTLHSICVWNNKRVGTQISRISTAVVMKVLIPPP